MQLVGANLAQTFNISDTVQSSILLRLTIWAIVPKRVVAFVHCYQSIGLELLPSHRFIPGLGVHNGSIPCDW